MSVKLTRQDLSIMFSLAKEYYISDNDQLGWMTNQEYIAQCYLKAAENILENLTVEYPTRPLVSEGTE